MHHDQLEKLEEAIFGTSDSKRSHQQAQLPASIHSHTSAIKSINPGLSAFFMVIGVGFIAAVVVAHNEHNQSAETLTAVPTIADGPAATQPGSTSRKASDNRAPSAKVHTPNDMVIAPTSSIAQEPQPVERQPVVNTATASDDLNNVRATDPVAARHIVEFCSSSSQGEAKRQSLCQLNESRAWQRLFVLHEFPSVSEDIVEKCKLPPFPDSFVAKEACTRYELGEQSTSKEMK